MKHTDALEQAYRAFQQAHTDALHQEFVEYLGVNFSEHETTPPVFKAYYTTAKSMGSIPALLQPLVERDMIHALNKIDDTVNQGCVRYEIGLQHRTNTNMAFVNQWIEERFPEIKLHRDEFNRFYSIKCVEDKAYQYAALYFLGLIADVRDPDAPQTRAIKLHYLLRKWSEPDKIGKGYAVDNGSFLEILSALGIPEMEQLCAAVGPLIASAGGELWMAAVDYYKDSLSKYKIYIKKFSEAVYESMIECFHALGCAHLAEQISAYRCWISLHPELERYGIALCLDNRMVWSVNFYH